MLVWLDGCPEFATVVAVDEHGAGRLGANQPRPWSHGSTITFEASAIDQVAKRLLAFFERVPRTDEGWSFQPLGLRYSNRWREVIRPHAAAQNERQLLAPGRAGLKRAPVAVRDPDEHDTPTGPGGGDRVVERAVVAAS